MPKNQENWPNDFEDQIPVLENKNKKLTRSEKSLFILMLSITFIAVGLGSWQFSRHINLPFELASSGETLNINLNEADDLLALQNKDTDGDGVSDFDELYVYQTSPYLEDSDSDGLNDSQELAQGTDPVCYEGRDCYGTAAAATLQSTGVGLSSDVITDYEDVETPQTIEDIRKILIDSGISESALSQVSDAELLQLYQTALAQTEGTTTDASGTTTTGASASGTTADLTNVDPNSITSAQLKDALKAAGVSAEVLSQFTDAELLAMYKQSISQNGTKSQTTSGTVTNPQLYEEIQKMSPEEVKTLLKNAGFSQGILDKYNEATLKDMLLGALGGKS
ncbi:MAG: thrombospondin type 3 repeat-containing protein [Patescibacteria group bacterium]